MDDIDTRIVSGLKDPWKFIFVDADIAMLGGLVGLGTLLAGVPVLACVALGGCVGYALHASRKGKPRGFGRHLAYWYFPPAFSRLKRVPPMWALRTVG